MEISRFLYRSDFTWNQFCGFQKCKNCHFCHSKGCEFCSFCKLQPSKRAKIHKNQNSEPLNVLKWLILHFENPQNWFHVKSEWYKNHDITTLCIYYHSHIATKYWTNQSYDHISGNHNNKSIKSNPLMKRVFMTQVWHK